MRTEQCREEEVDEAKDRLQGLWCLQATQDVQNNKVKQDLRCKASAVLIYFIIGFNFYLNSPNWFHITLKAEIFCQIWGVFTDSRTIKKWPKTIQIFVYVNENSILVSLKLNITELQPLPKNLEVILISSLTKKNVSKYGVLLIRTRLLGKYNHCCFI